MKKLCFLFAVLLLSALLFALPTAAADPVVYLANGGDGDGSSAAAPLGSLNSAYAALGDGGGTIVVCGAYTIGNTSTIQLPSHTGKVTFTSLYDDVDYREGGAELTFNGTSFAAFNGPTDFDDLNMHVTGSAAGICANFNDMTIGHGVEILGAKAATYYMYLIGGPNNNSAVAPLAAGKTFHLSVYSGKFHTMSGFSRSNANASHLGTAVVTIGGDADVSAFCGGPLSTGAKGGTAVIHLEDAAAIKTFYLGGYGCAAMNGDLTLNVSGTAKVTTISNYNETYFATTQKILNTVGSSFSLPAGYADIFDRISVDGVQVKPASTNSTVYVCDGGTGDGAAPEAPMGSFAAAFTALANAGGDIVLVGDATVSAAGVLPEKSGDVRITAQNGARLCLCADLQFANNTNGAGIIFDLPIVAADAKIFGGFRSVTFTENVTVTGDLDFYGGVDATDLESDGTAVAGLPYAITVYGGAFRAFYGGNFRSDYIDPVGSIAAPLTVTISGGSFGSFGLSGMSILADDATLTISGGDFESDLLIQSEKGPVGAPAARTSALTKSNRAYYAADGDITVNISGGSFGGGILAAADEVSYMQVLRGNYTVNITGGDFDSGARMDATQVKAYAGGNQIAALSFADGYDFDIVRFDRVNGAAQSYTEPLRVAFVGDSITEGPRPDIHRNSYPAVFASLAKEQRGDVIVSNYGIASSGLLSTTSTVYFDRLAYPMVMEETDADLIFIAIGTNDSAAGLDNFLEAEYRARLTALASDLGALPDTEKIFISTALPRPNENIYQIRVASVIRPIEEQVAAALAEIDAEKYHFVDLYALTLPEAAKSGFFSSDNLHPSVAGYAKMGQLVYGAMMEGTAPEEYKRTDVYLSASGRRYGAGTQADPTNALDIAISYIPQNTPATLHIVGTVTYSANIQTMLGAGKLTIVGEGADAVLKMDGGTQMKFYGDVEIRNLTLETTAADTCILGGYHNIVLGEDVTLVGDWSFAGGFAAYSRDTAATVSAQSDMTVTIDARGRLKNFTLGNLRTEATAPFGTYGGRAVATVGSHTTLGGSGATLLGAVGQNYLSGEIDLTIEGAAIPEYAAAGTVTSPAAYDAGNNTGTISMNAEEPEYENVIFLCDGGTGNGRRPSAPIGSIADAYAALPSGGTVVICGAYTLGNTATVTLPAVSGEMTITSLFGGVDYRESGAKLIFDGTNFLKLSGATVFDALTMSLDKTAAGICANFHPVTVTESVNIVQAGGGTGYYMYFIVGTNGDTINTLDAGEVLQININGGKYIDLSAFTRQVSATNRGTVILNVGGNADVRDLVGGALSTGAFAGNTVLNLTGHAHVTNLYLGGYNSAGMKGDAVVNIGGEVSIGAIQSYSTAFFPESKKYLNLFTDSATLPSGFTDRFDCVTTASENAAVKFVRGGATGSGADPFAPTGSIASAYAALPTGGKIVVMGETNFENASTLQLPSHTGTVTLTSAYGGMDFRTLADAKVGYDGTAFVCFNGDTILDDISVDIGSFASEGFCFNFHNGTLGEGFEIIEGTGYHFTVLAGANDNPNIPALAADAEMSLTIESGKYHTVSGFTRRMTNISHLGTVTLRIGGDALIDAYCVGPISAGARGGNAIVDLYGDAVVNKMYLGGYTCGAMNGDVTVNIADEARIGSFLNYGDDYFTQSEKNLNILSVNASLPQNYPDVFDNITTVQSSLSVDLPLPADLPTADRRLYLLIDGKTETVRTTEGDGVLTVAFESVLDAFNLSLTYRTDDGFRRLDYTVTVGENDSTTVTLTKDQTYDGSVVYIADGGTGDGLTATSPLATIEDACLRLGQRGGTVVVCGRLTMVKYAVPAHTGTLTFTSLCDGVDYRESGASLYYPVSSALTLGGETVFCNITLDFVTNGLIAAAYHPVTFDDGVTINYDWVENDEAGLYLVGGYNTGAIPTNADYTQSASVTLRSGSFSRVFGFSRYVGKQNQTGTANIVLEGSAHVRYLIAGAAGNSATSNSANIKLADNALIETLYLGGLAKDNYMYGETRVDITEITGGDIYEFDGISLYAMAGGIDTLIYNPTSVPDGVLHMASLAWIDNILSTCDIEGAHAFGAPYTNPFDGTVEIHTCTRCGFTTTLDAVESTGVHGVVYVADGGFGDGSSPLLPIGNLEDAFKALGSAGGVIVPVRAVTIPKNWTYKHGNDPAFFQEPAHTGLVTVTSLYDGVDYRTYGAKLVFDGLMDYKLSGPVTFDNINFDTTDPTKVNNIAARYNKLTFGRGVKMLKTFAANGYKLNVYGGYKYFRYTDFADVDIKDEWLALCNHAVELKEAPTDLAPINIGGTVMRAEAAAAFNALWAEMEERGMKLPIVSSAYQTYEWKYDFMANFLGNTRVNHPDWSYERAYIYVTKSCGEPHKSEHRLGVAVDMYDNTIDSATPNHDYNTTAEWNWLVNEGGAAKYGIILHYLQNEYCAPVTGFISEAWHFRYIGLEHTKAYIESGYPIFEYYIGDCCGLFDKDSDVTVSGGSFYSISGDSTECPGITFRGEKKVNLNGVVEYTRISDVVSVTGDANGDGKTSIADVIRILKSLADDEIFLHPSADINGDGKVTLLDALEVLRTVLG
ncbi:MAG: D-alanyl-D-alanine carboxypeptidase family protein [Clostridia bacterium]|nr:D-alanyl-D-alanine carboxypeptidase family protein [Clostridia bacterium]